MTQKIATLGPQGTFSDTATQRYIAGQAMHCDVSYFDSIKQALNAVGQSCDMGILPVENFSEGFISLVLDHLLDANLSIQAEIRLPIQFSLVSNSSDVSNIKQLFVQFVAKGQCSEFIDALGEVEIVNTESNIESLNLIKLNYPDCAAIVPAGSFEPADFPLVREEINDYKNNETRFLVLVNRADASPKRPGVQYKTSVIVLDENDHPGLLGEVLLSFSNRKINLTSIMSRPTRQTFGKYHFFIDFDGHLEDQAIAEALAEIAVNCKVKVLGSYPKQSQA